ncbi:phosphate acetyltransferase [Sulfurimonas marina]|uniref:Phosphate acetyltransferase n=1 Tax=Sulfurimonas marina TaxID=2590551 RepID=A0A7M1AWC9_9BACT|nr:phosphate acetyltransferase [Sulfurimonas marina]QOP41730.1 phosphate acetyltransferase [Sulfurimonas marina]
MQIKSLYIASNEKNVGSLFISMGMMELLKRKLHRVAFFRPVIYDQNCEDYNTQFILERYKLDMKYEQCIGFPISYVEEMLSQKKEKELLNQLIEKFKELEKSYDFVLCEGINRDALSATIAYDLNMELAKNFGSGYINIIGAKDKEVKDVYEDLLIENEHISLASNHFATFINRVSKEKSQELKSLLQKSDYTTFIVEENSELSLSTIEDLIEGLDAKEVFVSEHDYNRTFKEVRVAALSLDNFLEHIQEDDLIIVPADRSDIILGLLGALHSSAYPNISGIVFPFNMSIHPNIEKLIDGLKSFKVPILSVETDSYNTAKNIIKLHPRVRVNSERKIALALGEFYKSVDVELIEEKISHSFSDIMTPQMFEYKLFAMARADKKTIVLPESEDERVLRAAEIILRRDVADIILLGDKDEVRHRYLRLGLDLSKAQIIDHRDSELLDGFVEKFYEMRKEKGLTLQASRDAMIHANYFATMMVECGIADGMVSGAVHSTADTMRPALQIIKTAKEISIVSSVFLMCFETKVLVYGDCAINQEPDSKNLADIAIASAKTAKLFDIEPKVAMLSYSTGNSGWGEDVDKVKEATKLVKEKAPDLFVEGPIQYDAAINKDVARKKLPNSKVAGEASVFIFPDLNTGNNTYKAVQRSSGAVAIGPIIQGLKKPVNDLSRGCLVADIVNTIAITAIQAGQNENSSC